MMIIRMATNIRKLAYCTISESVYSDYFFWPVLSIFQKTHRQTLRTRLIKMVVFQVNCVTIALISVLTTFVILTRETILSSMDFNGR